MKPPDFDVHAAHLWFGKHCNNEAWELIESPGADEAALDRLRHMAHASVLHWSHVGSEVNRLRGLCLLTAAHGRAGDVDLAWHYGRQGAALADRIDALLSAFDRAAMYAAAARAARHMGHNDAAERWLARAEEAAKALDAEDRTVYRRLFPPA